MSLSSPLQRVLWLAVLAAAVAMPVAEPTHALSTHPPEVTEASIKSTDKGFKWLMKAMNRDGGFGVDVGAQSELGLTALVGLSMLSEGSTPREGEHARALRKIRSYVIKEVKNGGMRQLAQMNSTQLQRKIGSEAHTFFAALFLSQVIGLDDRFDDEPVRKALQRAVQEVVAAQQKDGSWGHGSWAPMLGTVMGWECLRGSHLAGFRVKASSDKVSEKLVQDMKAQMGKSRGWMHDLYKHATGIRVLYSMGMEDEPIAKSAFEKVLKLVPTNQPLSSAGGEEYLAFHLITETMLQAGGKKWEAWYPTVRDKIVKVQNADGSWTGHHCITSRTFCTAAAILTLQSPNRYLPISQE